MDKLHRTIITSISFCALAAATIGACVEPVAVELGAESNEADGPTPASLGLGDDWLALEPGLWTRVDSDGDAKYLGIGAEGKTHALASLLDVAQDLEERLADAPSDEAQAQLAELHAFIVDVRDTPEPEAAAEETTFRCSFNVSAYADAYPITCGAGATASASYSHPCGSTKGTVKTYATATCGYITKTDQCGPHTNDPVSCSSTASQTGNGPCNSYAQAQIYGVSGVNVYIWDNNGTRGTCGPSTPPPPPPPCGPCSYGKSCHCGDICRPENTLCP